MKVAMLHVDLPPVAQGGVAYQVDLLARTLVARGHEVTIFTAKGGSSDAPYEIRRVEVMGPKVLSRLVGIALAFRRVNFDSFDVIHAHGDDWLVRGTTPLVRTFYGSAFAEAISAKRARRVAGQLFAYATEWISGIRADRNVAISRRTLRYLPFVKAVVPCAAAHQYFETASVGRSGHPQVLLIAGSLGGRKRGQLVIDAVSEARKVLPALTLTVVSKDVVAKPGVAHRMNLSNEELASLMQESWLYCSAASYEGFGIPYVEALASGLPILTTRNHGATEILEQDNLGVLTDDVSLATNMIRLLKDDAALADLAGRGREAAQSYSADSVAANYEKIYTQAISA